MLLRATACLLAASCVASAQTPVKALLHAALEAQGGEAKLRALKNVQWEAVGYRNQIEESERPEGPYIPEFQTVTETHDFANNRYRNSAEMAVYPVYKWSTAGVVSGGVALRSAGPRSAPGTPQQVQLAQERMALSPERLLLTALDAPDAHTEPGVTLQSVQQDVVVFTLDGAPVRIFLNVYTHLPTAIDYSGPLARTGFWAYMGDHTMRTWYSFWWLARGGIHLPMQWNVEGNGMPDAMYSIKRLTLDATLNEADFAIPEDVRAKYDPNAKTPTPEDVPLGNPRQPAVEPVPGVVILPGAWNVSIVRQDDGLVILEAPISSGYSAKVIAEAKRRFPGQPIKAVISTSDSWPHLAGVREYVAAGIPVYALDLNKPILDRSFAAPHTVQPDTLQLHPRKPVFHLVTGKTVIGTGANRLEIYPLRGETSERQLMVYFPEHKLLYGSDPFQGAPGSFTFPQQVSELTVAVAREHLAVDRFYMMHIGLTPWPELAKALAGAGDPTGPQ